MREEPSLPAELSLLWRTPAPGTRPGRRPGLTLDVIAAAAVRLADADGLRALSMARVADAVGVTTMALYRYVRNKDELLALMYDAAMPPPPLAEVGSWRERLHAWCRAQLDLVTEHPWVVDLSGLPPLGPNRVRWIEAGLAALDGTALPTPVAVAAVGTLSLHVLTEGQLVAAVAAQQAGREAEHPALVDYQALLGAVADPHEHPRVTSALAMGAFGGTAGPGGTTGGAPGGTTGGADGGATGGADATALAGQPDELAAAQDFALTLLLDGVEALVARFEAAR